MRARLLVVPAAALVLLSGCNSPSTAFSVDGQRVTMSEVDAMVSDCRATFPKETDKSLAIGMANAELSERLAKVVEAKLGKQVTDADRQQVMAVRQVDTSQIAPACLSRLQGFFDLEYLTGTNSSDAIDKALAGTDVVVNPELGRYDEASRMIAQESTSMSRPGAVFGAPTQG